MTDKTKSQILEMREQGISYGCIASSLNIPIGTVRSYCSKHKNEVEVSVCLCCGRKLKQTKGHRQKKFCDNKCRYRWRINNPEARSLKAFYEGVCRCCGKQFTSYGRRQVFCSMNCYQKSRRNEND